MLLPAGSTRCAFGAFQVEVKVVLAHAARHRAAPKIRPRNVCDKRVSQSNGLESGTVDCVPCEPQALPPATVAAIASQPHPRMQSPQATRPRKRSPHPVPQVLAVEGAALRRVSRLGIWAILCESKPSYWVSQLCLAVAYEKLGRRADAEGGLKQ